MKSLGKRPDLCIGCRTCESVCSQLYFKEEDEEKSAIQIREKEDGYGMIHCTQCGFCIEMCPVQAIVKTKNTILIKKKECIHCLSCVGFCPEGAMRYHCDVQVPFKCVSCGTCVEECPEEAIFMVKEEVES